MKCVVCGQEALKTGDTCGSDSCIDSYLQSGQGSMNSPEYKSYIRRCVTSLAKQEGRENAPLEVVT